MIIIIMIILLLALFFLLKLYKKIESFSTNIFEVINLEDNSITKNKKYLTENLLVTKQNITKLLDEITIKPILETYHEIERKPINLEEYDNIIGILYETLKHTFENKVKLYNYKTCNISVNCLLELLEKKIIKLGLSKNKKIKCIEGQLLLKFNVSSYIFLLQFVITNKNGLEVIYLKLESISHIQNYKLIGNRVRDDISLSPYIIPAKSKYHHTDSNFTLIDDIINKPQKVILTKKESDILNEQEFEKRVKRKINNKDDYRCYGKKSINKYSCQNIYNSLTKTNISGIWDKKCIENKECPYFKQNLNYNNNFGGCVNGSCQMPLGLSNIAPHHYNKKDTPLCHNCKKGVYCCKQQKNKELYPNLKSPDYAFEDDYKIR